MRVPVIPIEAWNRHSNGYVPAGRSILIFADEPGFTVTSMPLPGTVNVCGVPEVLFTTSIVAPDFTFTVEGENEKSACVTVSATAPLDPPPVPVPDPVP